MIVNALLKSVEVFVDITTTHVTLHFEYAAQAAQKAGPYKNVINILRGVSDIIDERSLNNLKNKPCRVERNGTGEIVKIGHFLEDKWFTL